VERMGEVPWTVALADACVDRVPCLDGVGCAIGPCFGIGVGMSPRGVRFGAGASAGIFCGVGAAGGGLVGTGSAYLPFGLNSSFFLAPRFAWLEAMADLYAERAREKRIQRRKGRGRAFDTMWPRPMRDFVLNAVKAAKRVRRSDSFGPNGDVRSGGEAGAANDGGAGDAAAPVVNE
jgi:hypothetical protein